MTQIVILRVHVAPGREREFETLIEERARRHREKPGFDKMYLLKPDAGSEYRVVSWWERLEDPAAFVRQETYALSEDRRHAGIVVGPVPSEVLAIARVF